MSWGTDAASRGHEGRAARRQSAGSPLAAANARSILTLAVLAAALVVFVALISAHATAWFPVPFVDGWPAYHRLMNYMQGAFDLKTYLLTPHGAHLHSIIYLLYLTDMPLGGRQLVPHFASVAATAAFSILMCALIYRAGATRLGPVRASIAAAGSLVAVATLCIEILHPFQAVLTVSKLAYAAAFTGYAYALPKEKHGLHAALLAVSCVLVTFHGSGLLFAAIVLFQHLAIGRSWFVQALGAVPLMASFLFNWTWLPPGDSELRSVLNVLGDLSLLRVASLGLATSAYYAAPFSSISPFGQFSSLILTLVGGSVGAVATIYSLRVLLRWRRATTSELALASIGLFVGLSAASAAITWEARGLLGLNPNGSSYVTVASVSRYGALAVSAYAICFLVILSLPRRWLPLGSAMFVALLGLLLVSDRQALSHHRDFVSKTNLAGAALLMEGGPISVEVEPWIWPGVRQERFWPDQIKKVVRLMIDRNIGLAYGLPPLRLPATGWLQVRITDFSANATSMHGICAVTGRIPAIPRGFLNQPQIAAISDVNGTVLGYAGLPVVRARATEVDGYMLCRDQDASTYQLYLSTGPTPPKQGAGLGQAR